MHDVHAETRIAVTAQIIRNHTGVSNAIARIIAHDVITSLASVDDSFVAPMPPVFVPKEVRPVMKPEVTERLPAPPMSRDVHAREISPYLRDAVEDEEAKRFDAYFTKEGI